MASHFEKMALFNISDFSQALLQIERVLKEAIEAHILLGMEYESLVQILFNHCCKGANKKQAGRYMIFHEMPHILGYLIPSRHLYPILN